MLETDVQKTDVDFIKLQLWTQSVVLVSMIRGTKMNPFETQLSLQGEFYGKSALLFSSNGRYNVWIVEILSVTPMTTTTTKMIEYLRTEQLT